MTATPTPNTMTAEAFRAMVGADMPRTLPEQCAWAGLPVPVAEHRFCERRWRFDFAFIGEKVAVEIEGGVWTGGRHVRGKGYTNDMEKLNRAAAMGWTVLRFTPDQVRSGVALNDLRAVLA